jgi:hypothetical protein
LPELVGGARGLGWLAVKAVVIFAVVTADGYALLPQHGMAILIMSGTYCTSPAA